MANERRTEYMGKQKKFAKSPLLYIHQPNISIPKAPMQSNYATPKKTKQVEPAPEQKVPKANARPLKRDDFSKKSTQTKSEVETEDILTESEATTEEEELSNKKFNDMEIPEKIEYFLTKPKHIPNMKCEVKTEERSFRGTILDVEEDQVIMRVGRRSSTTKILIPSITQIRLIGF